MTLEQDDGTDGLEELLLVERTLGMAMRTPAVMERIVRAGVTAAEFEHENHQRMFEAMLVCFASAMRCDAGNVEAAMRDAGWKPADAKRWVRDVEDSARGTDADDETLTSYIDRIRISAAHRRLRIAGMTLAVGAGNKRPVGELAAEIAAEVERIVAGTASTRMQGGKALADGFVARLEAEASTPIIRAPLGIGPIDRACLGGPRLGSVLVFGADTGVGKTTFMRSFILRMLKAGRRVAVFTFESPASSIYDGLVEAKAGVRVGSLKKNAAGWSAIAEANAYLASAPLWIDDTEAMTAEELASKVHSLVKTEKVDVVFVDYVQDIERSTKHSRDDLNFAHISKTLRRLTQRYPILLVENAQLTDSDDKRRTPAETAAGPTEKNLAFTKQWAKDASYILMADRPKLSEDDTMRNVTRLRLVKNRWEGTIERAWSRWDPETTRIADCDSNGRWLVDTPQVKLSVVVDMPDAGDDWDRMVNDV